MGTRGLQVNYSRGSTLLKEASQATQVVSRQKGYHTTNEIDEFIMITFSYFHYGKIAVQSRR